MKLSKSTEMFLYLLECGYEPELIQDIPSPQKEREDIWFDMFDEITYAVRLSFREDILYRIVYHNTLLSQRDYRVSLAPFEEWRTFFKCMQSKKIEDFVKVMLEKI